MVKMMRIVFDTWSSDRFFLGRYFKGAGDFESYSVDSEHTVTSFTREGENKGFVFVGTPARCPDFIEKMRGLKKSYVEQGYRASPEVINLNEGIAGFAWSAPRGRK